MSSENKKNVHFDAPVIIGFVLLSALVMILNMITDGKTGEAAFSVYKSDYHSVGFYIRLLGHVLGNENWGEYLRNTLYILVLGPMLEARFKSGNMLIMIIITAFVTGLIYAFGGSGVLCGASCIVFMLMCLAALSVIKDNVIPFSFLMFIVIYILNVIIVHENVAGNRTGIIGGACGALFGYIISTNKK